MELNQLTALAREYAEQTDGSPADMAYRKAIAENAFRFLLRRYCLAEKEKLDNIYQGILVQLDPKNFGYSPYNQGRMDVIKSLFPEIGKEVEG